MCDDTELAQQQGLKRKKITSPAALGHKSTFSFQAMYCKSKTRFLFAGSETDTTSANRWQYVHTLNHTQKLQGTCKSWHTIQHRRPNFMTESNFSQTFSRRFNKQAISCLLVQTKEN